MRKDKFRRHRPLFAAPVSRPAKKPKIRWRIFPLIWLALKKTATVIGALVLVSALITFVIGLQVSDQALPSLPSEMVMTIDLDESLRDSPHQNDASFTEPFRQPVPTIYDVVSAIDDAAADKRVKGLLVRLRPGASLSLTHAQNFRDAVLRFRDTGKFAHIYAQSYSGIGTGLGRYYLASAFEQIWMQPMGLVTIGGLNFEMPFARGLLDKIGVTPQFYKREDYKTAYENLTSRNMSAENREMITRLVADLKAYFTAEISESLGIEPSGFEGLVEQALFTAEEAVTAGLVTHVSYPDVLIEETEAQFDGGIDFVDNAFYTRARRREIGQSDMLVQNLRQKPQVAVVFVNGAIMNEGAQGIAAADDIAPALIEASEDDAIQAVVLRVNSPGGSPAASERILRATQLVRAAGKPVIVSMGDLAASGGYWVAAGADHIFAHTTTITGSIGVVGGKFILGDLWDNIGVNWDTVQWGDKADMWSPNTPFSPAEAERVQAMLDQVYEGFLSRVANGRAMSIEQVRAIAGGRIWSGQRALEIGLVDELGTMDDALDFVAVQLGLQNRDDIRTVVLPKPKTALERFVQLLECQVSLGYFWNSLSPVADRLEPALQHLSIYGRNEHPSVLLPLAPQAQ